MPYVSLIIALILVAVMIIVWENIRYDLRVQRFYDWIPFKLSFAVINWVGKKERTYLERLHHYSLFMEIGELENEIHGHLHDIRVRIAKTALRIETLNIQEPEWWLATREWRELAKEYYRHCMGIKAALKVLDSARKGDN